MLDQNTDRMWYVIGAVIVGAALIFLVNSSFPQLFANIGNTYKDKTEQSLAVVDGIEPNMRTVVTPILNKDVHISTYPKLAKLVNYDKDGGLWELTVSPDYAPGIQGSWSGGLTIRKGNVEIPYGESMSISYEVWSPVDTTVGNDVNNIPVTGPTWGTVSSNDNDEVSTRRSTGYSVSANTWTPISYGYTNSDPRNVNKLALYDYSTFGVRNLTDDWLPIKIRNVQFSVTVTEE